MLSNVNNIYLSDFDKFSCVQNTSHTFCKLPTLLDYEK